MKKKILSLFMVIAITIFNFAPTVVSALSYDLPEWNETDRLINSYNVTSDVVTLYVGNISVNGTSDLKYLYTDENVNTETLTEMRKILKSDYASLLPTTAGQIKVSNKTGVNVTAEFKEARSIAAALYPAAVGMEDTSSTILYNQTQFNSLATASQAEISDEATAEANNLSAWNTRKTEWDAVEQAKADEDPNYNIKNFPEEYVNAFNDSTSYPTTSYFIADDMGNPTTRYFVRNGWVTQLYTYPVNRTIIKVVNTSANVIQPQKINSLNIKVASPVIGTTATSTTKPSVTIENNAGYKLDFTQYLDKLPSDGGLQYTGTFENGKDYYVEVSLEANENYSFVSSDDMTLKVNGKTTNYTINNSPDGSRYFMFYVKVNAENPSYEYIAGAEQTYTIGTDDTASFRINADYSLFENGGKVYVDGNLVDSSNYTSKSGSTIITFTKAYMSSLSAGSHTLKVVFNNGGTAETTFTVAKSSNPNTADPFTLYLTMLSLSLLGLASAVIYLNRNKIKLVKINK